MRNAIFILALAGSAVLARAQTPQFVISTLAGAPLGTRPVPALSVPIGSPQGLATDTAGNVYFTSTSQPGGGNGNGLLKLDASGILSRVNGAELSPGGSIGGVVIDKSGNAYVAVQGGVVVKVSSDGTVTAVAGNGSGFSGDGGPALSANINPSGALALDASGNLYVAEYSQRVRKISVNGIITTVVGYGSYGDAGDGGPATSAQLGDLTGLAVDPAGNLYISDNYYYFDGYCDSVLIYARLRMISPDGTIRTIAGGGPPGYYGDGGPAIAAQFMAPGALATDNAGSLYIADGSRVRKISKDGTITTVAGSGNGGYAGDGGPATSALLGYVSGLAVDSAGNLYIADGPRIRKVSPTGTISTVAGEGSSPGGAGVGDGGPAYTAILHLPTGVAVDGAGAVYIADTSGNRIRKVTSDGVITSVTGTGFAGGVTGDGLASNVDLFQPSGLATDLAGNLYIAESSGGRIRKLSPAGVITTVAGVSQQAVEPAFSGDGGPATSAQLWWPKDIVFDSSGNLYIADTGNNRVRMVTPAGIITTIAGTGALGYNGGGSGGDGGPAVNAGLYLPSGLAVDGSGNLYIADTNNFRVRKISPSGIISTFAGTGARGSSGDGGPAVQAQLNNPVGLKFDSSGNLYIADGATVRVVSPAGIITTVAGTGAIGFSGDGGPATKAQLGAWGLAFDGSGNLYVADPWGNGVRVLRPAGQ